jgi:hypothetical protein
VGCVGCEGCVGCVGCNEQSRPLLTFDIPQTALVATLDTYDFIETPALLIVYRYGKLVEFRLYNNKSA